MLRAFARALERDPIGALFPIMGSPGALVRSPFVSLWLLVKKKGCTAAVVTIYAVQYHLSMLSLF